MVTSCFHPVLQSHRDKRRDVVSRSAEDLSALGFPLLSVIAAVVILMLRSYVHMISEFLL